MATETTLQPYEKHDRITKQRDLSDTVFAFPKQRKEPLTDARHVRNAVDRFDHVIDVSDADRAPAFGNIQKAARYYGVQLRAKTPRPPRRSAESCEASSSTAASTSAGTVERNLR